VPIVRDFGALCDLIKLMKTVVISVGICPAVKENLWDANLVGNKQAVFVEGIPYGFCHRLEGQVVGIREDYVRPSLEVAPVAVEIGEFDVLQLFELLYWSKV
jgi:hypothetical protein